VVTTGAPKVILGTKWPSIISIWSQSAPCKIVSEHAVPRDAKSADRIEGATIAGGDIFAEGVVQRLQGGPVLRAAPSKEDWIGEGGTFRDWQNGEVSERKYG
jgi:hypothetical protein